MFYNPKTGITSCYSNTNVVSVQYITSTFLQKRMVVGHHSNTVSCRLNVAELCWYGEERERLIIEKSCCQSPYHHVGSVSIVTALALAMKKGSACLCVCVKGETKWLLNKETRMDVEREIFKRTVGCVCVSVTQCLRCSW